MVWKSWFQVKLALHLGRWGWGCWVKLYLLFYLLKLSLIRSKFFELLNGGLCGSRCFSLIFTVTGGKKEKDFAQTTSACLSFIQEALLKHQWQQAAEYMHSYLQILEDSDSHKRQAAPEVSALWVRCAPDPPRLGVPACVLLFG